MNLLYLCQLHRFDIELLQCLYHGVEQQRDLYSCCLTQLPCWAWYIYSHASACGKISLWFVCPTLHANLYQTLNILRLLLSDSIKTATHLPLLLNLRLIWFVPVAMGYRWFRNRDMIHFVSYSLLAPTALSFLAYISFRSPPFFLHSPLTRVDEFFRFQY